MVANLVWTSTLLVDTLSSILFNFCFLWDLQTFVLVFGDVFFFLSHLNTLIIRQIDFSIVTSYFISLASHLHTSLIIALFILHMIDICPVFFTSMAWLRCSGSWSHMRRSLEWGIPLCWFSQFRNLKGLVYILDQVLLFLEKHDVFFFWLVISSFKLVLIGLSFRSEPHYFPSMLLFAFRASFSKVTFWIKFLSFMFSHFDCFYIQSIKSHSEFFSWVGWRWVIHLILTKTLIPIEGTLM